MQSLFMLAKEASENVCLTIHKAKIRRTCVKMEVFRHNFLFIAKKKRLFCLNLFTIFRIISKFALPLNYSAKDFYDKNAETQKRRSAEHFLPNLKNIFP